MKLQCVSYLLLPHRSPHNLVAENNNNPLLSPLVSVVGLVIKGSLGSSGLVSLMRSQSEDFFILLCGALSGKIQTTLCPGGFSTWFPSPSRLRAAGLLTSWPREPSVHVSKGEIQVTTISPFMT